MGVLEKKPGVQNWIEKLPAPMRAAWNRSIVYRAAVHLHRGRGMEVGHAIASALNWARDICTTGDVSQWKGPQQVRPTSRAECCAAIALWESMKAAARTQSENTSLPASEREALDLAADTMDAIDLAQAERRRTNRRWDESAHPRGEKGSPKGGKFVAKDKGSGPQKRGQGATEERREQASSMLRQLGYKPGSSVEDLRKAVAEFQRWAGLEADGELDTKTLKNLRATAVRGEFRQNVRPGLRPKLRSAARRAVKRRFRRRGSRELATPSTEERRKAEQKGAAMKGGRFPIRTTEELGKAIHAVGRARGPSGEPSEEERRKVRRFIIRRAKALGATNMVPDNWKADGSLA